MSTTDSNVKSINDIFGDLLYDSAGKKLTDDMFALPSDIDFMQESFSIDLLNKINNAEIDYPFYLETPIETTPGYYDDKRIFIIKACPYVPEYIQKNIGNDTELINQAKLNEDLNKDDGDTVYFMKNTIQSGHSSFELGGNLYQSFQDLIYSTEDTYSGDRAGGTFGLRFLGIDTPEIPHYAAVPIESHKIITKTYGAIKNNPAYKLPQVHNYTDDTILKFIPYDNLYSLILSDIGENNNVNYEPAYAVLSAEEKAKLKAEGVIMVKTFSSDSSVAETIEAGLEIGKEVHEMIARSEDMVIMIDHLSLNRQTNNYVSPYASDYATSTPFGTVWEYTKHFWSRFFSERRYLYMGLNPWGQENNKRFLGTIYLKLKMPGLGNEPVWINLTKYIIQKYYDSVIVCPDYTSDPLSVFNNGFASDAFKLWTYDFKNMEVIDSFTSYTNDHIRERDELFQKLSGLNYDDMIEYKMILGDTILQIPPTSIRTVTQSQAQSMGLLRSRGRAFKSHHKTEKHIELKLYFNDAAGVNGVPYEVTFPNGRKQTYYMNGLRALIAQFKLTPFLPIENKYVNEILNVYAVTLADLQVNTVPGHPKLLEATLTLQEFNYRTYMPELPIPQIESERDLYANLFARCIHYPVMRWYYQRLINKGEEVKNMEPNSFEYLNATFGSNTALIPMDFQDSKIDFYLPDKEWLDARLQVALEKESKPLQTNYSFSESLKNMIMQIAPMYDQLVKNLRMPETAAAFEEYVKAGKDYVDKASKNMYYTADLTPVFDKYVNLICKNLNYSRATIRDKKGGDLYLDILIKIPNVLIEPAEKEMFVTYLLTLFNETKSSEFLTYDENGHLCVKVTLKAEASWHIILKSEYDVDQYGLCKNEFELDMNSAGLKLLAYCDESVYKHTEDDGSITISWKGSDDINMQDDLQNINSYNHEESAKSIKFSKYELTDDLQLESLSCSYANALTRISLNAQADYAHQFCGGQDIMIEARFTTKNDEAAALLVNLPSIATNMCIDYKKVLSFWPLRISSQITRLFGVNEVLIEAVDLSTVPNHPGVHAITVRMIAVDRSSRNKESLKKIEGIDNSGPVNTENHEFMVKTFYDLDKVLGQAEIYPDLELPTIDEVEYMGWKITKFYNQDQTTRTYVDPDFYFIYGHALAHELFRNSIMEALNTDTNTSPLQTSFELSDTFGSWYEIDRAPLKHNGDKSDDAIMSEVYTATPKNEVATELERAASEAASKKLADADRIVRANVFNDLSTGQQIASRMSSTLAGLQTPIWYISDNMTFPLRERSYERVLKEEDTAYVEYIESKEAEMLDIINSELSFSIADRYSVKAVKMDDISKKQAGSYKNGVKWAEKRLREGVSSFSVQNSFIQKLAHDNQQNYLSDEVYKLFTAYADTMSGASYCEQCIEFAGITTADDKYANNSWKLRPFYNIGEVKDDFPNKLIPFCKVLNKSDSSIIFANNMQEVEDYGYAFGVFQIRLYTKEEILPYLPEEEAKRVRESKLEYFFLDDYYRNLQLTDSNSEELKAYKRNLTVDPAWGAIAFARNLMFWYRALINDNVTISMYESIKKVAQLEFINSGAKMSNVGEKTTDAIKKTFEQYVDVFASSYARLFADDAEYAKTTEGMIENGVPNEESILKACGKFKNNTEKLLKQYKKDVEASKKTLEKNAQKINDGSPDKDALTKENRILREEMELLEMFISVLESDSQDYVIRFGTYVVVMKNTIIEESALNVSTFEAVVDQLSEDSSEIINGKIFGLSLLNMNGGSKVYSYLKNRETESLSSLVMSLADVSTTSENSEMRKYVLALDGRDVLTLDYVGQQVQSAEELITLAAAERVSIKRSNDIDFYLRDSFLDMIRHDKRGRMLRAFPTYYLVFIDEGRKIGLWKLHDNFYNMNAISEITVTKSRKIAADTAQITMSNMFKTYSANDAQKDYADYEINSVRYNMRDAFNSIFSPRTYYMKEELKRDLQEVARSTEILPGVRIHLRMGYGANAADLPTVFNGTIAEVGTDDMVQIIAQGDGVELLNPITDIDDSSDVDNKDEFFITKWFDNWVSNGATPRQIMLSLLMARGTWLKEAIRKFTKGRFYNYNPYGIAHFGDINFTDIFASGEVGQNIFEANPRASYGSLDAYIGLEELYDTKETPKISMHLLGKTFWDVMHICASAQPDYITSVVPFGLRSSIFYGAGRYYYAYDYERKMLDNGDQMLVEKRKPFQQYHLYSSFTDIIHNNIRASSKDVKTNAIGIYTETRLLNKEKTMQVGPLYVDIDIYPENQKSTTVDTSLWAQGMPVVGNVFGWTASLSHDVSGIIPGAKEIAWRMTANALKESMKDMYQGEITVMGDPTVKPYDRMIINDIYERMSGTCEVEAVVHSLNVDTGFTTSIYADCISNVDDKIDQYALQRACQAGFAGAFATVGQAGVWAMFEKTGRPITGAALKSVAKGISLSSSVVNNLSRFVGADTYALTEKLLSLNDATLSAAGFAGQTSSILVSLADEISRVGSKFPTQITKLSQLDDIARLQSQLSSRLANGGEVATKMGDDYAKAIKPLQEALNKNLTLTDDMVTDLSGLVDDLRKVDSTAAKETAEQLSNILNKKAVSSVDDMAQVLKMAGTHLDDAKVLKASSKYLTKLGTNGKTVTKVANEAAETLLEKGVKAGLTIAKSGTVVGWILTALELVANIVITGYVSEYIYRYIQNMEVLQIYPLKRNGKAMVAGLNGHKGCVVGSSTENTQGDWTKFITGLFDGKDMGGFEYILNYGLIGGAVNKLTGLDFRTGFVNQAINDVANTIRSRNDNPSSPSIGNERLVQKITEEVGTIYASRAQKDLRYLIYYDRLNISKNDSITSSYYTANRIELLPPYSSIKCSDFGNKTYAIEHDAVIKRFIDVGMVKLILENTTDGSSLSHLTKFADGHTNSVSYTEKDMGDGNKLFNIAALREDAIVALRDCLTEFASLSNWGSLHTSNEYSVPPLYITSCLVLEKEDSTPGMNSAWDSTGLVFKLQIPASDAHGVTAKGFAAHMTQYYKDLGADKFIKAGVISKGGIANTVGIMVQPVLKKE